jgi:hypothetical protein
MKINTIVVEDFKGRKLSLLSTRAKKTNGHRYMTRKSVAEVLSGKANRVRGGSADSNPVSGWAAHATKTRLRVGCHIFTGRNFQSIRDWALGS